MGTKRQGVAEPFIWLLAFTLSAPNCKAPRELTIDSEPSI